MSSPILNLTRIYVIGRTPPPVTGENLCRGYLVETLRLMGYDVIAFSRSNFRALAISNAEVWMLPGAKVLGHVRDLFLILWWLFWGNWVNIYVHNRSWNYFIHFGLIWHMHRKRIRFVVLTDNIEAQLSAAGYQALRLNNTLCEGGECSAVVREFVPRLIWMSAVTEEKGFRIAYEVFNALQSSDSRWVFDVYGGGPCARPEMYPNAKFHGFVNGKAKELAFRQGGILILPSSYVNETQPLAIIEALNYSVPFLASNIGGLCGMLGSPNLPSGICLPPTSPISAWMDAIILIKSSYSAYTQGAYSAYKLCFSKEAYYKALMKILSGPAHN